MSNKEGPKDAELDKNVEQLYKSMMQRDPRKRQVKLVKPHLMQLDFGSLEDSSDDSDFRLNSDAEDDDEFDDDDDDADNTRAAKSDDSDGDDDGEHDGDDENDSERGATTKEKRKSEEEDKENTKKKRKLEDGMMVVDDDDGRSSGAKSDQQVADMNEDSTFIKNNDKGGRQRIVVPICSVCMGDSNSSMNEIVECDGCHETVHEGCFGVSDSHSTTSSDSSSSMEPWFCDACKAGAKPHCELCPNLGGIFKETDSGRWVHLICALYTKGVAFGDVERLSNITLFEMPYSKWGAKECSLCEDPRLSRTGVCISCDAGMCRVHFHVTCAQRNGLLTEASPEEAKAIADPYFAYCKIHADKHIMRHNHRNWLALQSNIKAADKEMNVKETEKKRLERKLANHQVKYQEAKYNRQPCWVPKEKMPRMLLSSAYALKQLLRKAELQGVREDVSAKDTRKKGYIPPQFSLDFISYYLERNELMESMKTKFKKMQGQDSQLRRTERQLTSKIQGMKGEIQALTKSSIQIQKTGLMLWDFMMNVAGKRIRIPECVSFRNFARPAGLDDPDQSLGSKQIHRCITCDSTNDQHMLVQCDRCHGNYHLNCLDPPLTRMPKKTKSQGWQCARCTKDQLEEEEEKQVDEGAADVPRKLREKRLIREPLKYTTQFAQENIIRCQKDKKLKKKRNAKDPSTVATSEKIKTGQPPVEVSANSPLSISSEEEEEEEGEEEQEEEGEGEESKSEGKQSSEGGGSGAKVRSIPVEVLVPVDVSSTDRTKPATPAEVEASSRQAVELQGRSGGGGGGSGPPRTPVKRVIIRNVNPNVEFVSNVPGVRIVQGASRANVRVLSISSEKKVPIIIRRKQPLLLGRSAQAALPVQPAPNPSDGGDPIEISDDDDDDDSQ